MKELDPEFSGSAEPALGTTRDRRENTPEAPPYASVKELDLEFSGSAQPALGTTKDRRERTSQTPQPYPSVKGFDPDFLVVPNLPWARPKIVGRTRQRPHPAPL